MSTTRQGLKNLERKIIVNLNLAKSRVSTDGIDARIYNNALRRAKDIVSEIFNDEQATKWLEESEEARIKEAVKKL